MRRLRTVTRSRPYVRHAHALNTRDGNAKNRSSRDLEHRAVRLGPPQMMPAHDTAKHAFRDTTYRRNGRPRKYRQHALANLQPFVDVFLRKLLYFVGTSRRNFIGGDCSCQSGRASLVSRFSFTTQPARSAPIVAVACRILCCVTTHDAWSTVAANFAFESTAASATFFPRILLPLPFPSPFQRAWLLAGSFGSRLALRTRNSFSPYPDLRPANLCRPSAQLC